MFAHHSHEESSIPLWRHLLAVAIVFTIGVKIYDNSVDVPFHYDDRASIVDNRHIHVTEWDLSEFAKVAIKGRSDGGNNRPLAYLSFALNYYFSEKIDREDPDVTGFHVVNIAIHVTASILVYFIAIATFRLWDRARRCAGAQESLPVYEMSLFAAGLFVAHPIQTQAVTYIVQRMTSMAAMFYLASLLLYIYGRGSEKRAARLSCWIAAAVAAVMALATKQIAVTLPVVVLLYEWFFFRDLDVDWMKKAALRFVLPALFVLVVLALFYTGGDPLARIENGYQDRDFTMAQRLWTQPRVVMLYLSQIIYPAPSRLSLLHFIDTSRSLIHPITSLLSLLFIIALAALAVWLARRERIVSFGILWFLIHLVLESSIIGLEMIYEHRLYLPLFGLALAASYLLFRLRSHYRAWAIVTAILITTICGVWTIERNRVWQDRLGFWEDLVARSNAASAAARADDNFNIARVYNNYGRALALGNRMDEAYAALERSIEIDPEYYHAHFNLGRRYMRERNLEAALESFSKAIEFAPKDRSDKRVRRYPAAYLWRGNAQQGLGQLDKAIADYTTAIKQLPEYSEAYYERGMVFQRQGRFRLAIKDFSDTIRLKPEEPRPYKARGQCYQALEETERAQEDLATAKRLGLE